MANQYDRKNQAVWEFIDNGAFKRALEQCNRRIKKGEKFDYLLLLKAHCLTLLPRSTANHEEALSICRNIAVAGIKAPIGNLDVLMFLQRVWGYLNELGVSELGEFHREMSKCWDIAVKAKPGDERMAKEWVFGCVRGGDWEGAQKAAMQLQKNYGKRREYYFWAVVSSLLLHDSLPDTEKQKKKLFGMLAYQLILKAKGEVPPEANNLLLPPRAIQSAQEVHLLLSTISSASTAPTPIARSLEALEVLDSTNLGLNSAIAKGDYLGLLRRKLATLCQVGKWDTLWGLCGNLLHEAREPDLTKSEDEKNSELPQIGDDWALWDNYLVAARELLMGDRGLPGGRDKMSFKAETLKTVTDYISGEGKTGTRNSELAMVKFASIFHAKEGEPLYSAAPEGTPSLVNACKRYFDQIGDKNCCFEDLGKYVEQFDEAEQDEFLVHLKGKIDGHPDAEVNQKAAIAQIQEKINVQKFVYFLKISPLPLTLSDTDTPEIQQCVKNAAALSTPDHVQIKQSITNTLSAFAATCLEIYLSALHPTMSSSLLVTDDQYGDDAALLAVVVQLRLWKMDHESSQAPLLRAIFILETLLTKSRHNYQASLLLVRLYMVVGTPYLAASGECWGRLNVKQIQNDTLGHWLFTRGSTMFPVLPSESATGSGGDIVVQTNKLLHIYDQNRKQTPDMTVLALERGTYGQVLEFVQFGARVEKSISKLMYEVDSRRAERLRGVGIERAGPAPMIPTNVQDLVDSRDFGVLVNFERGPKRCEEMFLRTGDELPSKRWIRVSGCVEELVEIARGGGAKSKVSEDPVKRAENISVTIGEALAADAAAQAKEFTTEEIKYLDLVAELARVVSISLGTPIDPTKLAKGLEGIKSFFSPSSSSSSSEANPTPYSWHTLHSTWTAFESATVATLVLSRTLKPSLGKLRGAPGQKARQSFQDVVTAIIPSYVEHTKTGFASKLDKVERDKELKAENIVKDGGDALARVLSEGVFAGVDGVEKVLVRTSKGRKEVSDAIMKWVLPGGPK